MSINYNENDLTTETSTSKKEYLVSDDISEMFKSWIKAENSRKAAKLPANLNGSEEAADVTDEVTDAAKNEETTVDETDVTTE